MRFYLKEYSDGVEYSPVGKEVEQKKLDAGFVIVDEIPQSIRVERIGRTKINKIKVWKLG